MSLICFFTAASYQNEKTDIRTFNLDMKRWVVSIKEKLCSVGKQKTLTITWLQVRRNS